MNKVVTVRWAAEPWIRAGMNTLAPWFDKITVSIDYFCRSSALTQQF